MDDAAAAGTVGLKEHIEKLLEENEKYLEMEIREHDRRNEDRFDERDLRYDQRFREIEEARRVTVQNTEKGLDRVNEKVNDLGLGQKDYISRAEALALMVAVSTLMGCVVGIVSYFARR